MAKKPKKGARKADAPAPTQVSYRLTGEDVLKKLMRSCSSIKKQTDELVGSLREKIAYAVEKQFLHKGVFALIRQLDRKEPETLALWKATFDHYWTASGLHERAESAPSLPGTDGEEGAEEEDGEPDTTNVRALRSNGVQPVSDVG